MIDGLNLPTSLTARDASVLVRRVTRADLRVIIRLLSGDRSVPAAETSQMTRTKAPTRRHSIELSAIPATNSSWRRTGQKLSSACCS
jgi:hypothetical protein